jgi:hypothetical protein
VNERSSSGRLTSQSVHSSLSPGSDSGPPADVDAEIDEDTELLTELDGELLILVLGETDDEALLLTELDGEDDTDADVELLTDAATTIQ